MKLTRTYTFLTDGIWRITDDEVGRVRSSAYFVLKTLLVATRRFVHDRVAGKASALTYSTLLAIVPIMAIVFAIAKGFGLGGLVEAEVRKSLSGQSAAVEALLQMVDTYLQHTQGALFIGVGVVLFPWTVLVLISHIESTFNRIWEVKKGRGVFRRFTDYFSMLLLLPLLMVVSGGLSIYMSTVLRHTADYVILAPLVKFLVRLLPFVLTGAMFTGLYVFMPNTKVKLRYALLAGILAGSAYQGFQYLYIGSQIWVSRYNAIYGSFAALPLFLLWLQVSWTICLFGAELTYAGQNIRNFSFERDARHVSRRYHDFICLAVMSCVSKRFAGHAAPYTAEELARENRIPLRLVHQVLYQLQEIGFVHEVVSGDAKSTDLRYAPSVDIGTLSLGMLMERLESHGSESFKVDHEGRFAALWQAQNAAREQFYRAGRDVLLKDL